ncbi:MULTISPECIES: helix-turn-helix domain-containing protein [Actinomycetes]|uniref:helix-turn-helix domain-containing protein n=1 Tax=Actinomycetes TaxID=1760 RepID=UPI00043B1063|nr:helix-turn-helix domain-containing protein [Trueperella pyogenes]HAT1172118.1 helix-turn-helix domain-containing protein [Corynebacterium striatum]AHU89191.1 transcriptional regulator [Trueperella pyogenes]AWA43132.1 DNA-binding protein [Trueperella pyogenes]HAT1177249.1 helix-turn-helix domain-containing protein [Corynebacterium striatum]HAT1329461.1 helix-turn-helix domain-containing protein [Corynebacterium striatum]
MNTGNEIENWVNLDDVATHLSVSKDTVRNWTKEGRLPAYKAGKMYKYKLSEVDQWLRDGRLDQENAIG